MPSPFIHLEIAHRALAAPDLLGGATARRAGNGAAVRAAYLFGAVAPDVDKLLGLPRSTTHFWDAGSDVSGALKLLSAHPYLAVGSLGMVDRAFLAGYLCHLVTDEQWTFVIYRRYFGRHSRYGGGQEGAHLQLGLQGVLEAQQRARTAEMAGLAAALKEGGEDDLPDNLLPFVSMVDLRRWRKAVVFQAALEPGVDRFRYSTSLMPPRAGELARAGSTTDDGATPEAIAAAVREHRAALFRRFPALQSEAECYVAIEAVVEFEARAVEASRKLLGEYLAGEPLSPPLDTWDPTSPAT